MAESRAAFQRRAAVPLGLVGGARITRAVAKGDLLTYDDVEWAAPRSSANSGLQDRQIAENWTDEQTVAAVDEAIPA